MNLQVINGDLFDSPEQYICHQCNSVTTTGANFSKAMFARHPYADIYKERVYGQDPAPDQLPGNIIVRGNGEDQRFVINLIGQYYPGPAKYPESKRDGWKARQAAFQQCLDKITELPGLKSIAFPYKIGCGAAGGDWLIYRVMIKKFAEKVQIPVRIYKLP